MQKIFLNKLSSPLVRLLNAAAIWVLAGMMFLTFLDVLLRYLLNQPIQGAGEIVEFMMAIVVPFSIVICAQNRSHVRVDFIIEGMPTGAKEILNLVNDLVMLLLFIPITWQSFLFVRDEYSSNLTSAVLYIPTFPFVGIVAFAFLIFTLILLEQFLLSLIEVLSKWIRLLLD